MKSPVRRIHKVKTGTNIKDTYSDEALELMRDNCTELRDLAIIDMLASTGMRVGEMVLLNRNDIDFNERECIVFGKGSKERVVYFDARTKIHLQNYLESRTDDNPALFVSLKSPYNRLKIGGVEVRLREFGKQLELQKVHPHKFRRTLATMAIDKGMPIEQLQQLLGHRKIDTTLQYAMVKQIMLKLLIVNILDREEKIMAEWVKCTIGDLCDTISDTYKGNDENVILVNTSDVLEGKILNHTLVPNKNLKGQFKKLFSWSGSLLVDFWCGGICGLNQHLFKVTSSNYDKWFYYAWTKYHLNRFVAIATDKATTMGHIKRDELAKAEVLIPNKADYNRIGALLQPIYDSIISNRIENKKLAEARDALLPKLMSGEIDVSDIEI